MRGLIEGRPSGYDPFVEDILKIERMVCDAGPRGVAATMSYMNLISRYPRETEGIARELGTSVLAPLNEDRLDEIVDDRLRLAEQRLLSERKVAGEFGHTD